MINTSNGWISTHRSLSQHPLWLSEVFTRGQAWMDLLLLANHTNGYFRHKRGQRIDVLRGQVGYSMKSLANRWRWSDGKVKRFLNELEREYMVTLQKNNVTTIISIINYDHYQSPVAQTNRNRSTEDVQIRTNNNVNKKNKVNNKLKSIDNTSIYNGRRLPKKNIEERKQDFINEVDSTAKLYPEFYDPQMLSDFIDYWTERGTNDKKMRFEKQVSFGIKRRLSNWKKNRNEKYIKRSPKTENANYAQQSANLTRTEQAKFNLITRVEAIQSNQTAGNLPNDNGII